MSAAFANGGDAVKSAAAHSSSGSKQLKSNVSGKTLDTTRKQAGSPIDGPTKKKAWDNTNASIRNANGSAKPPSPAPSQMQNKQLHDRTVFLYSQLIGQDVTVSLTSGEQFTGVYSGTSDGYEHHIIKMTKQTRHAGQSQVNGNSASDFTGTGSDHELTVHIDDVADIAVPNVKLAAAVTTQQNGSAGFRTDTQISGQDSHLFRERELQPWQADPSTDVDLSLEVTSGGEWDQFAANKRLYGVDTDYNEEMYTTSIDRSNPEYRRRELEAERIAAEIERSAPANAHIAEERRRDAQCDDAGGDEEDKYSGVRRDGSALPKRTAGAYVPPSQRPITGAPTVPGAPFDPAIISSEIKIKTPTPAIVAPPADPTQPASKPAAPEPQAPAAVPVGAVNHGPEYHVSAARDAFKHFANTEKLRIKQAQEAKRNNVRQEKNVKLNDLKKFAANFKLNSRVPDDLVPILAKDPGKQVEIQTKAEQAAKEAELRSKERSASKASSAASPAASSNLTQAALASTTLPSSSNQPNRKGVPQLHTGVQPGQNQSPRGQLNAQFPSRQQIRGQPPAPNLRMPSGSQGASSEMPLSPASATSSRALNVKAQEFVYRPGAQSFAPNASPSPAHTTSGVGPSPSTPNQPIPSFFDSKKTKDTIPLSECFDAITFLAGADYTEEQKKKYAPNGGVPYSYNTPVTWSTTKENEAKSIDELYQKLYPPSRTASQGPSPMQTPLPGQMPQQLPPHGMPVQVMPVPNQRQPYYGPQSGHMPGYPGPNMPAHFQQQHSVQNSPRVQPMGPFNGQVPMQPFQGQGIPGYGASPSMGHRQPMPPGGMMPYQPGQMIPQPRPGYPGHGFPPQQMGGHMMMPNPSAGGYSGPVPGFSPMPHQAQPHMPYPQHGPGGFMAGSPRPHPMSQQGSQQGYQPHPPPGGQHPMHFQRTMSGGYHQMTPRQQAAMPHHGSPGMGPAQGDEVK
ncbi:Ataxin-2 [Cercospora beticola]|uniref:Ataxin-2 n=1 Tax=Cercospora beticola TaxID=122368 RepID=A0A2G5HK54_CERBT|nr:Ataxin-2 [Cercospora beticola]PIA92602.1 Ataxin-2 [Cercospora beticola]WPB02261.1 hypothetical protein RHO25_006895 [Cercospora beticola]